MVKTLREGALEQISDYEYHFETDRDGDYPKASDHERMLLEMRQAIKVEERMVVLCDYLTERIGDIGVTALAAA